MSKHALGPWRIVARDQHGSTEYIPIEYKSTMEHLSEIQGAWELIWSAIAKAEGRK